MVDVIDNRKSEEEVFAMLGNEAELNREIIRDGVDLFLAKCTELVSRKGRRLGFNCKQKQVNSFKNFQGLLRMNDLETPDLFFQDGVPVIIAALHFQNRQIRISVSDIDLRDYSKWKTIDGSLVYNACALTNKPFCDESGLNNTPGYGFQFFSAETKADQWGFLQFDSMQRSEAFMEEAYLKIAARFLRQLIPIISEELREGPN